MQCLWIVVLANSYQLKWLFVGSEWSFCYSESIFSFDLYLYIRRHSHFLDCLIVDQEEPEDKTKHWGDLEEEEEEEDEEEEVEEPDEDELEDGIQSVDSLSRYFTLALLLLFRWNCFIRTFK